MNDVDFDKMTVDELTIALNLDKEERDLLESIENDEWVSIPNEKEEIKHLQKIDRSRTILTNTDKMSVPQKCLEN